MTLTEQKRRTEILKRLERLQLDPRAYRFNSDQETEAIALCDELYALENQPELEWAPASGASAGGP